MTSESQMQSKIKTTAIDLLKPERIIAIGDVHGCLSALDALADAISFTDRDLIVTLGDYIDRGPNSKGVIDRLIEWHEQFHVVSLLGNHEEMLINAWYDKNQRFRYVFFGRETLKSYGISLLEIDDIPKAHRDFLEETCVHYLETEKHILVHGYLDPESELSEHDAKTLLWKRIYKHDAPSHKSGKTIICGHTAQAHGQPLHVGHAVCIDTFACGGQWLSALDLNSGTLWRARSSGEVEKRHLDEFRLEESENGSEGASQEPEGVTA